MSLTFPAACGFFTSLRLDSGLELVIVSRTTMGRVRLYAGTVGPCRNVFTRCNHALSFTWTWWITQTTGSQCCQWFPVHSGKQLCIVSSSWGLYKPESSRGSLLASGISRVRTWGKKSAHRLHKAVNSLLMTPYVEQKPVIIRVICGKFINNIQVKYKKLNFYNMKDRRY